MQCAVCRKSLKVITTTHLRVHGLSVLQYRSRFPHAPLASTEYKKHMSQTLTRQWKENPEVRLDAIRSSSNRERLRQNAYRKLGERSEAWRDAFRETMREVHARLLDDPEYRLSFMTGVARYWKTSEAHEQARTAQRIRWDRPGAKEEMAAVMRKLWRTPEFQKKMEEKPSVYKWTKPERRLRAVLRELGLYRTGSRSGKTIGFVPHGWVHCGSFIFNADQIDYNNRLIIHVDGDYWHGPLHPEVRRRDRRNDRWCKQHGWRFLRLSESSLLREPEECRRAISSLTSTRNYKPRPSSLGSLQGE